MRVFVGFKKLLLLAWLINGDNVVYVQTLEPNGQVQVNTIPTSLGGDTMKSQFEWFNANIGIHTNHFSVTAFLRGFWDSIVKKSKQLGSYVTDAVHKLNGFDKESKRIDRQSVGFMTFNEYMKVYNISTLPPITRAPINQSLRWYVYTGIKYKIVDPSIAELYQPYSNYSAEYYAPVLTSIALPMVDYIWPWSNNLTTLVPLFQLVLLENSTSIQPLSEPTIIAPNTNTSYLERMELIWEKFDVLSGIPLSPKVETSAFMSKHEFHFSSFFAYPISPGVFARSGVTYYSPALLNWNSTLLAFDSFFAEAFNADLAAFINGTQSPSSTWLSDFDRSSDEYADLCMGSLIKAKNSSKNAIEMFNLLVVNSANSCLWNPNAYYYRVKSQAFPAVKNLDIPLLALNIAAQAFNLTEIKDNLRPIRERYMKNLLQNASTLPIATIDNGVISLSPNADNYVLQKIREPEPVHLIYRGIIRLGEASLLSAEEMDKLFTCTAMFLLNVECVRCIP
uniref:Secreted protein n=1 Tax=Thraustotheca clavata TaxID=74557 RepID=A0A0A7CMK4_9STRA|nr:secreted protein [Thraustotheca clavata]